jgi:hypothetical protein
MNFINWTKLVQFVGKIVFIMAGFLTFGDALLFEKIYIALLVFMAVIFIRDINIVSIIVISAIANLSSELLYFIVFDFEYQITPKLMVYVAICITLFKLKTEEFRIIISVVIGLCIAAEMYWIYTGYDAPSIYWYVLLININLAVRFFLFSRVFITSKYSSLLIMFQGYKIIRYEWFKA